MSAESTRLLSFALMIIGGVMIGVCIVMGMTLWWCTHADNPDQGLAAKVCGQGNIKDIALALIGAASALAGAVALRGRPP